MSDNIIGCIAVAFSFCRSLGPLQFLLGRRKDHVLAVPTLPEQVEDRQPVGSQMIVSPSIRQDRTGRLAAAAAAGESDWRSHSPCDRSVIRASTKFESRMSYLFASFPARIGDSGYEGRWRPLGRPSLAAAAVHTLTTSSADSVAGTPSTIYVATVRPTTKRGWQGKRRSGGTPYLLGCDEKGKPLDPNHWWKISQG